MRVALTLMSLLLVAAAASAADPVYLDELMESPLPRLQTIFTDLRKEGCYQIADDRFLLVTIEKKEQKPWRIVLASALPCKRAEAGPQVDIRERSGVELGESQTSVVQRLGRPQTAVAADANMKKFGDFEYFYICRVSESCARHTSVFFKNGLVSAIAEWYSE
jgi:hypothetical protein